jgi:hypothetical protein
MQYDKRLENSLVFENQVILIRFTIELDILFQFHITCHLRQV